MSPIPKYHVPSKHVAHVRLGTFIIYFNGIGYSIVFYNIFIGFKTVTHIIFFIKTLGF